LAARKRRGPTYVHPFADPQVIAGRGTPAPELPAQAPEADTPLVAVGGPIAGAATAAKALRPGIEIVGVEPTGAPTLRPSIDAGRLVTPDEITTVGGSLAPRRSINYELIAAHVDRLVLVTDEEMRAAARRLWFETGVAAELAGAASPAALMTGRRRTAADEVAVVCGAGMDGL